MRRLFVALSVLVVFAGVSVLVYFEEDFVPDAALAAGAAGAPVLVGAGDIASCAENGDTRTARLVENIPGTVFTTGDNAYNAGTAAQFRALTASANWMAR